MAGPTAPAPAAAAGHASSPLHIRLGYGFAILAAALFGSVSTVAKPVASSIHPLLLSSFVYLVAAATLAPLAYMGREPQQERQALQKRQQKEAMRRRDYLLVVAIAAAGAATAPALYFAGLQTTSAADATLLVNAEVIFTAAIAIAFFKERLRLLGYVAFLLVLAGVVIISTNLRFADTALFSAQTYYGDALILSSTLFWAIDNNISRIVAQRISVAKAVHLKSAIGGVALLAIAASAGVPLGLPAAGELLSILLLGAAGFGASLYFFFEALKRIGTVRSTMLLSTSSVFGLIFAALFLGEHISGYQLLATAVMLGGIYIINRRDASSSPLLPKPSTHRPPDE